MGFLSASSLGREREEQLDHLCPVNASARAPFDYQQCLCAKAMQRLESHSRNSIYLIGFVMV
jgi:hypothetical protein